MLMNGSDILLACLKEQGVDTIFGYPGGAILNVYDALYKDGSFRHILTSHEQGASHAADGYARATGKVGVVFATSGPGATNLVTGIATAQIDSVPMVAITCNVGVSALGKDSFQEVDITGITTPIVKHNYIVKDINKLADTIRNAFRIAQEGRPGVVLVDIPKNVTAAECEYEAVEAVKPAPYTRRIKESDVDAAVEAIKASKKPMILVGGGAIISGCQKELAAFVNLVQAPVCDTLMGKGAFDEEKPNYTGMIGMHGTKASNFGLDQSDLVIILGSRLSDRVTGDTKTFGRNAKFIHIDVDVAEIDKNKKVDMSIHGDLKVVLQMLNERLTPQNHTEWMEHIFDLKKIHPLVYNPETLNGPYILETINKMTKGEAIVTTDVGQHQMWASQFIKFRHPRTFLTSGGLGTMGYGLGAAIGAQIGVPERQVINIGGDGCFRMNMNELATAARYGVPMIQVCINNHVLGMVHQWQQLFYEKRYSQTIFTDTMDFVKVAEAMGCKGIRVTKKEEFVPAFQEALDSKIPVVLDCWIDCDDNVYPMVPAGGNISDAFNEEDLAKKSK